MPHSRAEILAILDECCLSFGFPMLDNGYVYPAATRLSLFRSAREWGMVIEVFGFSPRVGLPDIHLYTLSNAIANRKTADDYVTQEAYDAYLANNPNNELSFICPIDEGPWQDPEELEFLVEGAKTLTLRGRDVPLPTAQEYLDAGVHLSEPPTICTFELCRVLAHQYRDDVLATPEERRPHLNPDLDHLITLEEWRHPDPDFFHKTGLPSASETFRQLAAVLETGDVSLYRTTEGPNTHWRHWPDAGTM